MSISDDFRSKSVASAKRPRKPTPFSLRLSGEERAQLEQAAGNEPLGAFIRAKLLGGDLVPRRTRGRTPVGDHVALAKVLAALGASRLSSNLNQIAKAVHLGALPVSDEVERDLNEACGAVRDMRMHLLRALGMKDEGAP